MSDGEKSYFRGQTNAILSAASGETVEQNPFFGDDTNAILSALAGEEVEANPFFSEETNAIIAAIKAGGGGGGGGDTIQLRLITLSNDNRPEISIEEHTEEEES